MLVGIAAVVIDLGHAYVVKREVQKAVEAGALTGARALALDPTQSNQLALTLNWSNGKAQATKVVQQNYVNGALLSNFNTDGDLTTVQAGYWDLRWTTATAPANLNGYLDPAGYTPDTKHEIPAVKVTLIQTQSGSGSTAPMPTYFASVLGVGSMTMQASAVAILPSPTKVNKGGLFPFALPESYVKKHWADDPPTSFTVGSVQHDSSGGQWTTFENKGQVGADVVDNFINYGNDIAIAVGDPIFIQSGEESSVYNTVQDAIKANPDKVWMVPVVADDYKTGDSTPVKSFVPYKLTACTGSGSQPYVTGQFVPGYMSPYADGVSGDYNGDPNRPRLVN